MIGGVVGYTYAQDNLCPSCTVGRMRANGITVARGGDHEAAIRRAAERVGVDFSDERSYDSGDFPKTITGQQASTELTELPNGERGEIEDEKCDRCGLWMKLGEKSPTAAGLTRYVRDSYELPQALARAVAGTLREWGLSHPEFFDADNVKQAAALHVHDWVSYRFVDYPKSTETEPISTPDTDGEECVHCGRPFEEHTLTCEVCKEEVPAVGTHSHEIRMKGQRSFPGINKELTT
ncbi:hypothetical protein DMB38_20500 [Streptomyces sp. WAC 06738]|uniref:hypothetical protein n=1 Tax=Streptomyces sp. WAC 06738 TaxID=2203210 RepID=UPI000F6D7FB5|nr:hypothetical protein [Streptomyces sp. WAC 06738]AZM47851.1 hypothetical protein DMB38_20500 [Streptomyces sp. WAC 06738]